MENLTPREQIIDMQKKINLHQEAIDSLYKKINNDEEKELSEKLLQDQIVIYNFYREAILLIPVFWG